MNFDAMGEAKEILHDYTTDCIQSIESDTESEMEIYEDLADGCGYLLVKRLLNGKYSLLEYIKVRNALGELLLALLPKGND